MRATLLQRTIFLLLLVVLIALLPANGITEDAQFEIQGEWIAGTIYSNALYQLSMQSDGTLATDVGEITYEIDEEEGQISLTISGEDGYSESAKAIFIRLDDASCLVYNAIDDLWTGNTVPTGYYIVRTGDSSSVVFLCYDIKLTDDFFLYNNKLIRNNEEKLDYLLLEDKLYITDGNEYMAGNIVFHGDSAFMYDTGCTITQNENYPPIEIWMLFIKRDIVR